MTEKEMMLKGYLTSNENAKIIESIIQKHRKTTEKIM